VVTQVRLTHTCRMRPYDGHQTWLQTGPERCRVLRKGTVHALQAGPGPAPRPPPSSQRDGSGSRPGGSGVGAGTRPGSHVDRAR